MIKICQNKRQVQDCAKQQLKASKSKVGILEEAYTFSQFIYQLYSLTFPEKPIANDSLFLSKFYIALGAVTNDENQPFTNDFKEHAAPQIAAAYKKVYEWDQTIDDVCRYNDEHKLYVTDSQCLFVEVSRVAEKLMVSSGYVFTHQVVNGLIDQVKSGSEVLRKYLEKGIVICFHVAMPPVQKRFWNALAEAGVDIKYEIPNHKTKDLKALVSAEQNDEFTNVARYIHKVIEQAPQTKCMIVHPKLHDQKVKRQISDSFRDVFEPQSILSSKGRYTLPFNISCGEMLSSRPVVDLYLTLIQLDSSFISIDDLLKVVSSPFLSGFDVEEVARTKFAGNMVSTGFNHFKLEDLMNSFLVPRQLSVNLKEYFATIGDKSNKYYASEWIELINSGLAKLGYLRGRELDHIELQEFDKLNKVLLTSSGHFDDAGEISYSQLLGMLRVAINNTVFNVAVDKNTPVTICGVMEAGGTHADLTVVMNTNTDAFYSIPEPTPYISEEFLIAHDMPNSSVERETLICDQILDNLKENSKKLVFSYAERTGVKKQRPISFVKELPALGHDELSPIDVEYAVSEFKKYQLVSKQDETEQLQTARTPGGKGVIETHLQCHMSSYLKYRLGVKEPQKVSQGINKAERSQVIHDALDHVYQTIHSKAILDAIKPEALFKLILAGIDIGLRGLEKFILMPAELKRLETKQAFNIITEVIELDRQGGDFEVLGTEKTVEIKLGVLILRIRLDRIDKLVSQDGEYAHLRDYKGTAPSMAGLGKTFIAPQLPLGLLGINNQDMDSVINSKAGLDLPVRALSYTQLKEGDVKSVGVSDSGIELEGVRNFEKMSYYLFGTDGNKPGDFEQLKLYWKEKLVDAAFSYQQGHAEVNPVTDNACMYCFKESICQYNTY